MTEAKLHFIGTPLGNRNDITLRALETLKSLHFFFAEDSREFFKLLDLYQIPHDGKRVHSYGNHNMKEATSIAMQWLEEGHDVGFVSDRGMPGISDPGALLAERARAAGYPVLPVPGPAAVTTLLAICGYSADRFLFLGFLPLGPKERGIAFATVRAAAVTACFYESPKRIRETLSDLAREFPNGQVFLGREMTKLYESYTHLVLRDLAAFEAPEKGEYTVVLDPGPPDVAPEAWREEVRARLAHDKEWAKGVAARYGMSASEVYNALQDLKRSER